MTSLAELGAEQYVLLTTFRRDGRAVPTPLWAVPDGEGLGFWTPTGSGKVKRIRNSGRVTVAPCDVRGNPKGEAVEAVARLGDPADHVRIGKALNKKYGLVGRLVQFGSRLRRGADGTLVVLVSAAAL